IRVARVFGIDVYLDASWFLISFLIAWSFSTLFSQIQPSLGLTTAGYFLMGILAAVLFFASVLAHEISHSLVARARGISVRSITLFVFGGVAQIRKEPETPGDEFRIAIIGPVTSIVLGVIFILIAYATGMGEANPASLIFETTGFLNLALAAFNLVPGFPLDGGRVLRAAVWKWTGDLLRSTRVASIAGQVVAGLLIAVGLVRIIFLNQLFGGIWSILIGLFLNQAAQSGYQQLLLRQTLQGLRVRDLMTSDPESIPGNMRVQEAVDTFFLSRRHTSFPVLGFFDAPEGIVTLQMVRDTPREEWDAKTIRQIMAPREQKISTTPDEPLTMVLERMPNNPIGRFLVVEDDKLAGFLSVSDILRHLRVRQWIGKGPGPDGTTGVEEEREPEV
ncbi:MAG: site-2 protease family protein, partial [Acidimicrobiia bacterium]